jgi:TonB-dependent starch-binding outer membrane protein SusC
MSKIRERFLKQHFTRVKLLFILALAFQASLFGQEKQIKGTVTDVAGAPLPGVNVTIKESVTGTVTDIDGKYSIMASPQDVLVFSFVGYLAEEYKVEANTVLDVTLDEDIIGLDEVVVIGYGTQKKKLNTGANLNVSGEDIQAMNTTSSMDALKGLSPGVSITQNNGVPGAGNKIFIRGIGTTGNFAPLYIVDGVAVSDIDNISPSDIETLDILKDAASAAIYGSRGANGVILVTTKKGKKNTKPIVSYNGYYGWQNVVNKPQLLNAQEYTSAMDEANASSGFPQDNFAAQVPNWESIQSGEWKGTNWFDEIEEKNAPVQDHTLSITGGSDRSVFSISASYLNQQGVLGKQANNDYERVNLRLNSEHILFQTKSGRDLITLGENLTYTNEKNPTIRTGNIYWNDLHNMLVASPFLPMYAEDQSDLAYPYHYCIDWNTQESNPVAEMNLQSQYNTNTNNTILGNAYLEIEPIKDLVVRSSFGVNNWYGSSRHWTPAYHYSTVSNNDYDQVDQSMYSGFTWTSTNTITYSFDLKNVHKFTFLLGNEYIKNTKDLSIHGHNENSIFNDPEYGYLDNFDPLDENNVLLANFGSRDNYGWAMASYFGRLSYDYKETYLLTAVLRYDGSSNFDRGHRWGQFPSVSAGWVISNESFMTNFSNWLNFMKLRASWGQNGNQDIGRDFVYLSSITVTGVNYFFGPNHSLITVGSTPTQVPNTDISWETSEQTDIGLDMNFLGNKLQFSFDWYMKDTKDWLVEKISSSMDGTNPPWVNGGLIRNKGIETLLRWNDQRGNFKYSVTGTFAYNKNEVLEVPSSDSIFHGPANVLSQGTQEMFRAEVGYPIGYFWGFETDGVMQNEEEVAAYVNAEGDPYFTKMVPGDLRFVDKNNDGAITNADKVMIGNPHPDFIFGLQISVDYKGIYLQMTGNGVAGNQIAKNYRSIDNYRHNYTKDFYDLRWHGEGTSDKYPRLVRGGHRDYQYISDIYIYNGDFFRISNLTIGYDFKKLWKKMPLGQLQLYGAAKNLYTFTKYPGMDPEVGYSPTDSSNPDNNFPWGSGIDLGLYPQSRTFMIGLNIIF